MGSGVGVLGPALRVQNNMSGLGREREFAPVTERIRAGSRRFYEEPTDAAATDLFDRCEPFLDVDGATTNAFYALVENIKRNDATFVHPGAVLRRLLQVFEKTPPACRAADTVRLFALLLDAIMPTLLPPGGYPRPIAAAFVDAHGFDHLLWVLQNFHDDPPVLKTIASVVAVLFTRPAHDWYEREIAAVETNANAWADTAIYHALGRSPRGTGMTLAGLEILAFLFSRPVCPQLDPKTAAGIMTAQEFGVMWAYLSPEQQARFQALYAALSAAATF